MKKSLAPVRRQMKLCIKATARGNSNTSIEQNKVVIKSDGHEVEIVENGNEHKYRNQSIVSISTPLLVTISSLNTLDISYNSLNDSQIELIMNSCVKLLTLCIQGNLSTIVPASLWKLRELVNFKHDWVILLSGEEEYETADRLASMKTLVQKPGMVVKINKIVGMDFQTYAREIAKINLENDLVQIVENTDLSLIAKDAIIQTIKQHESSKHRHKNKSKVKPLMERDEYITCHATCGFDDVKPNFQERAKQSITFQKKKSMSKDEFWEAETSDDFRQIRSNYHFILVKDIKDISGEQSTQISLERGSVSSNYSSPSMPFHQLLGSFDSNSSAATQIDALLMKGYNPNQYDSRGMSPYHICLIERQKKGFKYLLNISNKNPGFFDIEMPSQKQLRNILHYCVFLKDFEFTKQLIQFGLPIQKRDFTGSRIIHLVDNNQQFMLLLRKLLRKRIESIWRNAHPTSKKYVKHPLRIKEEARYKVMENRNDKLIEMYQAGIGFPLVFRDAF